MNDREYNLQIERLIVRESIDAYYRLGHMTPLGLLSFRRVTGAVGQDGALELRLITSVSIPNAGTSETIARLDVEVSNGGTSRSYYFANILR